MNFGALGPGAVDLELFLGLFEVERERKLQAGHLLISQAIQTAFRSRTD
jgi:hypothetical protein